MRLLLTLIMAFGMCLTSFGAATWPASTNGNNTFFGNNTFKTPSMMYGATVTNAGNTAYLYISGNSGIGGLTGVIESTPSGMVLSGDTGLGNSIQISPLGVLSGNGSGLTSLTLPDPMTLNQLNVNTLIVTNAVTLNLSGSTNYYGTNLNNGGSAPGQILTATSTGVAWSNAPASTAGSTNIFDSGTAIWVTNNGGANFLGGTNLIGGTQANPVLQVSNNTVQLRNATANGTNICYINPSTGALLWNSDRVYDIGASGSGRPNVVYAQQLKSSDTVTSGSTVFAGTANPYSWSSTLTWLYAADTVGSFQIVTGPGSNPQSKCRFYEYGPVKQLSDASAAEIFYITSRTNSFCGGTIDYSIYCSDGTEVQTLSGIVTYAAANKAGVWTSSVTENASNQAKAVTTGTLTTTWTGAAYSGSGGTTNWAVSVSADTSLSASANQFYILWQIRNNGTNAVTPVP